MATMPSGARGWWSKSGSQLRKNARCSDNLYFLKCLFQNSFGFTLSYTILLFYFTGNNFTTNVPYPRLWPTPHLSPVLHMKHPATSLPHREQKPHTYTYHISVHFLHGAGWGGVGCGGVPLSKRKTSSLKIVHKREPNTERQKIYFSANKLTINLDKNSYPKLHLLKV